MVPLRKKYYSMVLQSPDSLAFPEWSDLSQSQKSRSAPGLVNFGSFELSLEPKIRAKRLSSKPHGVFNFGPEGSRVKV